MTEDIAFSRERHIGLVTLKRPQALNALSLAMIKALQEQLLAWQNDNSIHAVVLRAEGEKAFCAGGDVRLIYEAGLAQDPTQLQFFWHEYRLNYFIHKFPKPYISLMDGITMGGGVGISLHGSHPVASERFVFAMPETGIGFFPDIGASYLLSRCPGQTGLYLGLTGNRLNAEDTKYLGLVKYIIRADKLESALENLINADLSKDAGQVVHHCLQQVASPMVNVPLEKNRHQIDAYFASKTVEEIFAMLKQANDEWSKSILRTLEQKSPLSLKITLAQIQRAKTMTMAECMKMDYCLVSQFMKDSNFYEGVRALLIDKDKNPHWQPDSLAKVTNAKVADYFECTGEELLL